MVTDISELQINLLAEIDSVRAQTSKKDSDVRCAEIRRAASDGLLSWIAENGAAISRDTGGCLVVCEVMLYAEGGEATAIFHWYNSLVAHDCVLQTNPQRQRHC